MKIYEKPLADIKTFDVEDVMTTSTTDYGNYSDDQALFGKINLGGTYNGVVFKW